MVGKVKSTIEKNDQESYDAQCECGFVTYGWPLKRLAKERIEQHHAEHETGDLMPDSIELLNRED